MKLGHDAVFHPSQTDCLWDGLPHLHKKDMIDHAITSDLNNYYLGQWPEPIENVGVRWGKSWYHTYAYIVV